MKWTAKTIMTAVSEDLGWTQPKTAECAAGWAVHRSGSGYTITHVRSGLKFGRFATREHAKSLVEEIDSLAPDIGRLSVTQIASACAYDGDIRRLFEFYDGSIGRLKVHIGDDYVDVCEVGL